MCVCVVTILTYGSCLHAGVLLDSWSAEADVRSVCWRMLTYASVCSRMLLDSWSAEADVRSVCWRMLTYASVCERMRTYAYIRSKPSVSG